MNKARLETFSDGVFAIVITLLVLDIKLPAGIAINTDEQLRDLTFKMVPAMGAYVLSFCIIGIFWSAHGTIFGLIKTIDKTLLWLNLFYLMVVAFIPFPTSLLAGHIDKATAVILYSATLALAGLFHFTILKYVYERKNLSESHFTAQLMKSIYLPALFGPACYLLSISASFISIKISYFFIVIVPVYYIFFGNSNKH